MRRIPPCGNPLVRRGALFHPLQHPLQCLPSRCSLLSTAATPAASLAVRNAHPNDRRIAFDDATHTYTLDGSF
jgi:hypothetical protein